MCNETELAALEEKAVAVLDNEYLSPTEKADRLAELRREYRECVQRYAPLLAAYSRRARGRSANEVEGIVGDLLSSPEFQALTAVGFAVILTITYTGVLTGFSAPGFPLLPLESRGRATALLLQP